MGYAALVLGGLTKLHTILLSDTPGAKFVGTLGADEKLVGLTLVRPDTPRVYVPNDASRLASFALTQPNTVSTPIAALTQRAPSARARSRPRRARPHVMAIRQVMRACRSSVAQAGRLFGTSPSGIEYLTRVMVRLATK